ncbi:RCC1 domain-containing protein [Actinomadura harenae]|uniref:Chromosome condensation regulator RCC1 n=1 Tax=Actinomadura harenae TaxID=2483351 RepID=A0A3M2L4D1_9ACTN|nr:RCC1 domain-containing protein [Actinomadura harenae]RMI32497.1 hypothetical protein EBO15_41930 [Actinomadura harenae]
MKRYLAWAGLLAALLASISFAPAQAAPAVPAAPAVAAAGAQVTALTAGAAHTCALFDGKTLRCWGDNQYGELGIGTNAPTPQPSEVQGLAGTPTATLSRAVHNCSLLTTGTVQCWGMNKYGQLGDGNLVNTKNPIQVKGLRGTVRLLAVGGDHTCVVYQQDDSTWCWGQNKYGELGDGTLTTGSLQAVQVKGLPSPPERFATGVWTTCAILKDGSTWCWGHNEEGELGNGTKSLGSPKPVQVKGLASTPTELVAGNFHTCALEQDGSMWCWGENKYGQIGDGSVKIATKPTQVTGLPGTPAHIIAGGYHTCATFSDGGMSCWGQNNFGQLGDGTNANSRKPVPVKGFRPGPTLITAGGLHTCAAYSDGAIDCWGLNAVGQLGNTTARPVATTPVPVTLVAKAAAAAPAAATTGKHKSSGSTTGEVVGIGLAALAVAGFVAFLATRRRRA